MSKLVYVILLLCLSPAQPLQTGEYPPVASVATYRPAIADSVCGADGPEQYCQFTTNTALSPSLGLLPSCLEATCDNTCPHAAASPIPFRPAAEGVRGSGITLAQGREPGGARTALRFENSFVEVPASQVPELGTNGFSFAAWINIEDDSNRG